MKILLINNFFYRKGGSETVFFNTADLLKQHGHTVYFFSQKREQNETYPESESFPDAMDDKGLVKRVVSYFYNAAAARELDLFLSGHKVDIAHIHLFWGGLSPSILRVLKKHRVPVIHTAHDYRMLCPVSTFLGQDFHICEECSPGRYCACLRHKCAKGSSLFSIVMMLEMIFRKIFFRESKWLSGIIYVSQFSQQKHFEKDPVFRDIKNIQLYNFSFAGVQKEINTGYFGKYDVFMGRLSPEKGIAELIQAWKLSGTEKKLHILGDGPQRKELEQFTADQGISNVIFEGFCNQEKITGFLEHADYLILPSIWYENNPMTIIEAFAQGVPAIGMQIGGIPELIGEDRGFLISYPASAKDIAAVLQKAHSVGKEEYQRMQSNCREFCVQNFSAEVYYNKMIAFYKNIIGKTKNEAICE